MNKAQREIMEGSLKVSLIFGIVIIAVAFVFACIIGAKLLGLIEIAFHAVQ